MPEELQSSPFQLSEGEATSRIAAKIYHEQIEALEVEVSTLRQQLDDLRSKYESERNLRTQYSTYYKATNPAAVLLALVCSLLAGILTSVQGTQIRVVLVVILVVCLILIYKISSFGPKAE